MQEMYFESHGGAALVETVAKLTTPTRITLGPGRFVLPKPLMLTCGVELVGEVGKTILDGQGEHGILVINKADAVTVEGITFERGAAAWGAAIMAGSPVRLFVDQCRFAGNQAGEDGGAVFVRGASESRIVRSIFENNAAGRGGGGLDVGHGCDVLVDRCVFHGNSAKVGGGVLLNGTGALELRNCTFVDNHVSITPGGAALFVQGARSSGPSAYISSSVFAGPDAIAGDPATKFDVYFAHSVVPAESFGNHPGFQNTKANTLAAAELVQLGPGVWTLAPGSKGTRTADAGRIEAGATDLLGRPLVRDGAADPGAFAG